MVTLLSIYQHSLPDTLLPSLYLHLSLLLLLRDKVERVVAKFRHKFWPNRFGSTAAATIEQMFKSHFQRTKISFALFLSIILSSSFFLSFSLIFPSLSFYHYLSFSLIFPSYSFHSFSFYHYFSFSFSFSLLLSFSFYHSLSIIVFPSLSFYHCLSIIFFLSSFSQNHFHYPHGYVRLLNDYLTFHVLCLHFSLHLGISATIFKLQPFYSKPDQSNSTCEAQLVGSAKKLLNL